MQKTNSIHKNFKDQTKKKEAVHSSYKGITERLLEKYKPSAELKAMAAYQDNIDQPKAA